MKKISFLLLIVLACLNVQAQDPVTAVIKEGIKKVIKAVDLQIQRLQNETIRLQNAQKLIENTISEMHLKDISDWTQRQKNLYEDYFDELQKIKTTISSYHKVRSIIDKQSS